MKGVIWVYYKKEDSIEYRFQIDGIKRGVYTKVLDPIFKEWHTASVGYNHKLSTETVIYSGSFPSENDMFDWVKKTIEFPTIYTKCDPKCTTKVLVKDKNEVKNVKKPKATKPTKTGGLRKSSKT
jgi:hypothetical protein